MVNNTWDKLAAAYESSQVKEDSLDTLIEYPVQHEAMGSIQGKRILDIACGSGRKARDWAMSGASEVYAFDISDEFVASWTRAEAPHNLKFFWADLSDLGRIPELRDEKFDLVTSFQAVGYSEDLLQAFREIRRLLHSGGRFVISNAHPFRFVVEKMESQGLAPAVAYRDERDFTYESTWVKGVQVTHPVPMISTRINALIAAGFSIEKIYEPELPLETARKYPHKKSWMDKYFGIIVYSATAI